MLENASEISVGRMRAKGDLAGSVSDLAQTKREADTIRADLIGQNQATARGVTVSGRNAPVLALCRALIGAGHDSDSPLEAYRGSTLCLRVRSIGEGAALTVKDGRDGKPRFARFHPFPDGDESYPGRPPVAPNASEVANQPSEATNALAEEAMQ
jgi:hypothetical protein